MLNSTCLTHLSHLMLDLLEQRGFDFLARNQPEYVHAQTASHSGLFRRGRLGCHFSQNLASIAEFL